MERPSDNEQEFEALIEANRARILRLCRVYAWTPADQDDLGQEILAQLWRSLPTLRERAHASTWLYRVALNTAISFARRDKPRRGVIVEGEGPIRRWAETAADAPPEPNAARLEALYAALDHLNKIEKAVITLFLEDLSYEEMAETLGISVSHVGVLLHRARKNLSAHLKEASL